MRVKDLMTTGVCCVRPETEVVEIARQMRKENVGSIPVCSDSGQLLGIVTDRDIVIRYLAAAARKECAADIMSTNIITADQDMNIHDAALLFSAHQVRRLPVTAGNRLVGILATADIARRPVLADEAGDMLHGISKQ